MFFFRIFKNIDVRVCEKKMKYENFCFRIYNFQILLSENFRYVF